MNQINKPSFCIDIANNNRGWLLNLFNLAVRDGAKKPSQIIFAVLKRVDKYLSDPYLSLERAALLDDFKKRLETMEAFEYANYVLNYEQLPAAEKLGIKEQRANEAKNSYLGQQPATEKQINYLRKLGYKGEIESKRHASLLIDQCLGKTA